MNIIFLCRLYKPHVGGVEKHVEEISKILSKKHSITIITEQHDPKLYQSEDYPEAKVYRIPLENSDEKGKKWVIWKWMWKNRHLFYTADIIHIHDVFFWILPILPFLIKPKLFMTFHGYEGSQPPKLMQIFWHKLAQWFTWGNICIGDFHRKWYFTHPDFVSYGAVEVKTPQVKKAGQKAIFVGRLDIDTGIMDYLSAAKQLKLPLDVYGDGPLLGLAKEFTVKLSNINLKGFVPDAANSIPGYTVAFISRYLGILEALSAGVPVVAHSDSTIKYDYLSLAPFAKFIYIVSTPIEIISAYKEISQKPYASKTRIQSGYNWARAQTWSKLTAQYESLWLKPNL